MQQVRQGKIVLFKYIILFKYICKYHKKVKQNGLSENMYFEVTCQHMKIVTTRTVLPLFSKLHIFHHSLDMVHIFFVFDGHIFSVGPGCLIRYLIKKTLTFLTQALQT